MYNASHPLELKYCFPEFSEHHVWNSQSKTWTKRKRDRIIGRLTFVAPLEGERYYLRLLLAHVVGPCSFNALVTVDNHLCSTLHEEGLKRELVEPDDLVTVFRRSCRSANATCFATAVCYNTYFS